MKKILLSIAFALMGIASGFAAKAYSGIITVTQSDGTELNVRIYGDEHSIGSPQRTESFLYKKETTTILQKLPHTAH